MSVTFYQGKYGSANNGATAYACSEWTFKDSITDISTENMQAGGYYTSQDGMRKGEGTIKCFYDGQNAPAPAFDPGTLFTFALWADAGKTKGATGTGRVVSRDYSVSTTGVFTFDVSFVAQATYTVT